MLPSRIDKKTMWKEHAKNFTCDHSNTELRERTVKGGRKQYVHQCLLCGDATTSPIKTETAIKSNNGELPKPFDEDIKERWHKQSQESAQKISSTDDSAFWDAYANYLQSPEWATKRDKVLKRANDICEGCLINAATQVHHLIYEHVGHEFLFELVAICDDCHERMHPEPTNTDEGAD